MSKCPKCNVSLVFREELSLFLRSHEDPLVCKNCEEKIVKKISFQFFVLYFLGVGGGVAASYQSDFLGFLLIFLLFITLFFASYYFSPVESVRDQIEKIEGWTSQT